MAEPAAAVVPVRAFLSRRELARLLGVHIRTLDNWRAAGVGPEWSQVGRQIRYRWTDVDSWLAVRRDSPAH